MRQRTTIVVSGVVLAAVLVGGTYMLGLGPFAEDSPSPTPEVKSLEITDRGCRGTINEFGGGSVGPGARFTNSGVINTSSPATELSAKTVRTSPNGVSIPTYRTDITTHNLPNNTTSCRGTIAYRVVINAPSGSVGARHSLYIDGREVSCGGSTSGQNLGCYRLDQYQNSTPSMSTNGSIETATPLAMTLR
jgi:hypothetical protein